jgi:high affinity choline transporter 7
MTATWVDGGYLLGTTEGAYKSSIQLGIQAPVFRHQPDPGRTVFRPHDAAFWLHDAHRSVRSAIRQALAAVLFLPALASEFWSAELLVAIGSTFGVISA